MELYAGLDLHSRNTYIGIMEEALPRLKYLANKWNYGFWDFSWDMIWLSHEFK